MSVGNLKERDWKPTDFVNVNHVPIDKKDWNKVKEWCHERGMRTGDLLSVLVHGWLEDEGL